MGGVKGERERQSLSAVLGGKDFLKEECEAGEGKGWSCREGGKEWGVFNGQRQPRESQR